MDNGYHALVNDDILELPTLLWCSGFDREREHEGRVRRSVYRISLLIPQVITVVNSLRLINGQECIIAPSISQEVAEIIKIPVDTVVG